MKALFSYFIYIDRVSFPYFKSWKAGGAGGRQHLGPPLQYSWEI